jgi:hypothetical protein
MYQSVFFVIQCLLKWNKVHCILYILSPHTCDLFSVLESLYPRANNNIALNISFWIKYRSNKLHCLYLVYILFLTVGSTIWVLSRDFHWRSCQHFLSFIFFSFNFTSNLIWLLWLPYCLKEQVSYFLEWPGHDYTAQLLANFLVLFIAMTWPWFAFPVVVKY